MNAKHVSGFGNPLPALAGAVLLAFAHVAFAAPITCPTSGTFDREATLDSGVSCVTGLGNPQQSDIDAAFPGDSWTMEGELEGADGTNDLLTVTLTSGSWGSGDVEADWIIAGSFWTLYAEALISMHVGNGGGDPDHWIWLVTPGATTGTIDYEILSGTGGGLSNIKLWGRGTPSVAEPATLSMLGAGLFGLGLARRRRARTS